GPIERRMRVARFFPNEADIQRYAQAGLGVTVLALITHAPRALREDLLVLALEGHCCEAISDAKKAGTRELRASKQKSPEELQAAMLAALAKRAKKEAQQKQDRRCPRCKGSRGERRGNGEREEALPGSEHGEHAAELRARLDELSARARELDERERALIAREQGRQAELAEKERQLLEKQAQLQPDTLCLTTVLALYEQVRQHAGQTQLLCEQALSQRAAAEAGTHALRAEAQDLTETLAQQRAALAQEQAEVRAALDR